ncbi:MAG: hypothetical protein ACD_63C00199G0004 [uncultured bacterium]|nr:MAG: hypothetical protein ACD_63C00199G0004 [uncultured bacterium]
MDANKKKIIIDIVIILVIALVSLSWFSGDLIVSSGDNIFNYKPTETLDRYFNTWDTQSTLGIPDNQSLCQIFPYQTTLALADQIGIPLHIVQKIQYYILFAFSGLTMYFLVRIILKDSKHQRLPAIFAALFYMFNPFALVVVWGGNLTLINFYAILPFFIGGYLRGIRDKKYIYVILIPVVGLLFSMAYSVTALILLTWLLIFSMLFFYIIYNLKKERRKKIFSALKFTLLLLLVWFALNSYWLLPYINDAGNLIVTATYENPTQNLIGVSQSSSAVNAFRMLTYPPFYQKFMGVDAFFPYAGIYNTLGFQILSGIFTTLALIGIFFSWKVYPKHRKILWFLALLFIVTFFLFRGSNSIFGNMYIWMMESFPWMVAFRIPIDKFGPLFVLAYAIFAALGLSIPANYIFYKSIFFPKITKRLFIGVLAFLLVGVLMFPMWTGQVFYRGGTYRASYLTKPPSEYSELADYLRNDPGAYRLFPIPICGNWGCGLWWNNGKHGHSGGNPHFSLLPKSAILVNSEGLATFIIQELATKTEDQINIYNVNLALGLLNVKYFLLHRDLAEDYFAYDKKQMDLLASYLDNGKLEGITKAAEFGDLTLYQLNNQYYLPQIYAPNRIVRSNIALNEFPTEQLEKEPLADTDIPAFINLPPVFAQEIDAKQWEDNGRAYKIITDPGFHTPMLDFKQVSPSKWRVIVTDFQNPFLLVMSQQFNNKWKMYTKPLVDEELIEEATTENIEYFKNVRENKFLENKSIWETVSQIETPKAHLLVNGYANGWWIEGYKDTAEFELILEYSPQRLYYIGVIVSLITVLILIFSYLKIRKKSYGGL